MLKINLPANARKYPVTGRVQINLGKSRLMKSKPDCCSDKVAHAAIAYAQIGLRVLPLHTIRDGACTCKAGATCPSPGKHPLLLGGANAATADLEEVERLWHEHPGANVGIATGEASGVIALDVDPRNGGDETIRRLTQELGQLPRTVCSDTGGGGSHRLFCYPEAPFPTRHDPVGSVGLDVQSDKAFIVAPPSLHISGERYEWREGRDPASLPMARLAENWLTRLQGSTAPQSNSAGREPTARKHGIAEGGRNSHLTSRAGAMRQASLSEAALLAALKVENSAECVPPLDEDEVARIAASVSRYPVGQSGTGDEAETIMQIVLDQHFARGMHLLRPADGKFWVFNGRCWVPLNEKVLAGIILKVIQTIPGHRRQNTAGLMRQVGSLTEARVAADGDPLRFSAQPLPVINCRNGELWIGQDGSLELRQHDPKSYLRHCLDVDYDPAATCPQYDKTVLEIFARSVDPAAMVRLWHELVGYATQPDRRVALIALGEGAGSNGKTKLVETYTHLVGRDLVVAMPIGDIEKSRFIVGSLLGKHALIDDDVKAGTRLPDGQLKRLSEEKTMTGENKFGPPFTFKSRTAIFMLFNNPPSLADLSYGMQRRIVVVPFKRSFSPEETDTGLFQRIWATEMPGVLNRYLAGLQRVIGRGWAFEPPDDSLQAKDKLLQAANPVPAFIEERCERTGSIYVQALFDDYRAWAELAGITITQQRLSFQRNLENLRFEVKHGSQGPKVYGLRLRSSSWPRSS